MTPTTSAASSVSASAQNKASEWFMEAVQTHEPHLRAYLQRRFPSLVDIDDIVQESYLRLFRAKSVGRLRTIRGFLFTAARNAACDFFRRSRAAPSDPLSEADQARALESPPCVAETVSRAQELALLAEAIETLPRACRQVLKLRKIYGLSHKEIASRLNISERTVNVQVGLGIKRCAHYLAARGVVVRSSATKQGYAR
jgi:RNA polymerase sigma factor (sigma-70 family)